MTIQEQFGANVRRWRESKNWSQENLAEAADLHRTYISGIETGARNPTLTVVLRLAEALGATPAELLAGGRKR